ncbi:MAG: N-acetylmuramoyl-L-alanine amidase [Thermaerobacterales bacterium]
MLWRFDLSGVGGWRPLVAVLISALLVVGFSRIYVAGSRQVVLSFLAGRIVVIDPGHGGPDPGSIGSQGTLEKDVVLAVALKLRDYLTEAGAEVIMTRTEDVDLSGMSSGSLAERKRRDLQARVDLINEADADILVSVHANAIGSPRWSGAQTFYHAQSPPASRDLAETVQQELIHITGETTRAVSHHIQHRLLTATDLPAVTVEVGFLSNPREESLLMTRSYQDRVAWAMFVAIARYFSITGSPRL